MKSNKAIVTSLLLAVLPTTASAAIISWSTSDMTGDTDISTNGSSVFAIRGSNADGATVTVNGVTFVHATRANLAAESLAQSGAESLTTTLANDNAGSFQANSLTGAITGLVNGGYWGTATGTTTASLDFTGLIVGDTYEIQLFINDSRNGRHDGYTMDISDGNGGAGVTAELNNTPGGNAAGDSAIGTFTADAATQSVVLAGFLDGVANAGRTQVNAMQLRNTTPIPEPSSALLALVGLGFGLRRRR